MSPHDKTDADGAQSDGVPYKSATDKLPIYAEVRQQLASFQEPVLLHADNPHERLFVAAMDGTGNDMIHDPDHITNVGLIAQQIQASNNPNIRFWYVPGPGTQQHAPFTKVWDDITGYTVDERAEEMYKQFIEQASEWLQQDPHAQIRVVGNLTGIGTRFEARLPDGVAHGFGRLARQLRHALRARRAIVMRQHAFHIE